MKPVAYISCDVKHIYEDGSIFRVIRDRFNINLVERNFISELDLNIAHIKFPPNFNDKAYRKNISIAQRYVNGESFIAPKTYRIMDYSILTDFQKELFAFSIVKSIQLMLRIKGKSIKDSCIVIYDANDKINSNIIFELAKKAKYIILLAKDIKKASQLREYIISNYGVSPIITNDFNFAIKSAEFVVSSRNIDLCIKKYVWYINNIYTPDESEFAINDITFSTQWNLKNMDMNIEVLGAILGQMGEKDIEKSLKYNGVYIDKIMFNNTIKDL